jgi:hypothetical protein
MRPYRFLVLWIVVAIVGLLSALALLTGEKESEVAGTLVFSMLILGFPASVMAYPLGATVTAPFELQNLFAYNSRIILILWWASYFLLGLAQWWLGAWWVTRRNLTRRSSGPAASGRPLS